MTAQDKSVEITALWALAESRGASKWGSRPLVSVAGEADGDHRDAVGSEVDLEVMLSGYRGDGGRGEGDGRATLHRLHVDLRTAGWTALDMGSVGHDEARADGDPLAWPVAERGEFECDLQMDAFAHAPEHDAVDDDPAVHRVEVHALQVHGVPPASAAEPSTGGAA